VILLDTNALIWLERRDRRARRLTADRLQLHVSPASILELRFLEECGRIRLSNRDAAAIAVDERWTLDDPPAAAWFEAALDMAWTRDPFDRLLAAHARLRGWRLATSDSALAQALGARHSLLF
jgi:PIN domain nuclease of toxin-antitoxin system